MSPTTPAATVAPGKARATSTSSRRSRRNQDTGGQGAANPLAKLTVLIVCLLWIVPTFGLLITSFRNRDDANSSGWWNVFTSPSSLSRLTFDSYHEVWTKAKLGDAFINSFAIALPATFIPVLIAAFAAYAFAFMRFPGRDVLFILIVSLLVVPNYVALVPLLKIYGDFHLTGTFPAVWLAHIGFGMSLAIYIFRNYMSTLPKELIESAKIDGASHFTTFWRLIIPMSVPALASFAIFQFLWVWNDLLVALVFIGTGDNQPITIAVKQLIGQQGQGWQLVTAGGFISMIVPIIVFLSLQRFFVRGLTAGSVKG
ncbi:MAG: alpha-glucoside transport system permease protein [Actinomycetota bacterium]|jgi:alpha-glucoside transport system permease protein|nr:alpha-glucoside transport system permease protein [Actinomycetota bacterium]